MLSIKSFCISKSGVWFDYAKRCCATTNDANLHLICFIFTREGNVLLMFEMYVALSVWMSDFGHDVTNKHCFVFTVMDTEML